MELLCRSFDELSREELYELLRLRCAVFVVEQNCPYQDLDGLDSAALHLFLRDEEGIQACLRLLPPGLAGPDARIGRVLAVRRRCGLASRLLEAGIRLCRERYGQVPILVEAQTYARSLYEKQGFRQTSEEFLEDGIPHIQMRLMP